MVPPTAEAPICPHCSTSCADGHQYCPACGFPIGTMGAANEDKFVGKTLPGGYHILDLISVGGMGRVYRAEQSVLGRTVAVKIIHPHLLSDENSAVRFMTEARAASQLNHPNSVAVFDFGRTEDGQPYLVMEYLRGRDLARVAYEEGPLPFTRIVDVLRQTLAALGEAHDLGIVHRDLKPENVILEPMRRGGDFVKVVDFGLAKLKADTQAPNVTSPGIVCGTPDYMAPEQGRGDNIDGRSDLYAMGVILFQLLTGQLPYEAENPTQVVMMHMTLPIPDLQTVAPERAIPDPLIDVVKKAMAKDAKDRYHDALEFSDALREALAASVSTAPAAASSLAPPGGIVTCPACHRMVASGRFCGECGSRLPSTKSMPTKAHAQLTFPLPLVGREQDVAWLAERLSVTQLSGARLVAEAGLGKTRLLDEVRERAAAEGMQVHAVDPDPYYAEVAFYVLRRLLESLTGLGAFELMDEELVSDPEVRLGIDQTFLNRSKKADQLSAAERRHALAKALEWALGLAADRGPTLVTLDDLQRVDAPSRRAIADALSSDKNYPVLFVAAHTPGFETGWGATNSVARVLEGLSLSDATELLGATGPSELLESVHRESERGILPLYVEQLLRYNLEGGSEAPIRLGDVIAGRLHMLSPDERRVLQGLAVLGDARPQEDIEKLVPTDEDTAGALRRLESAGMLKKDQGQYSTTHPLLREVVLAGIPVAVRRELHAKALMVAENCAAPIETQAVHAFFAQESFQALLLLEQVADRARARDDLDAEVLALRRGLELARMEISRGELDDPLRAVLIFSRKLGEALTRSGSFADAEGVLREVLDVADPVNPERARILASLAQVARGRQRISEALSYLEQAIRAAGKAGSRELVASLSATRDRLRA